MKRVEIMSKNLCEWCKSKTASNELINLSSKDNGKSELVCFECFNQEVASSVGIDLEAIRLKVMSFKDVDGTDRKFNITRQVFPIGICIEANEITVDGSEGYKVAVHGEIDCNQRELLKELINKIKKQISTKYI